MSAVGAIGGSLISGAANLIGGQATNAQAESNIQQSEAYNTQMADTTYQRTVADLEAAGLNPMLAVGAQDPSPTIGQAPVVNALGNAMNQGITNYSALQSSRQVDPTIDNTKADTNLKNANAGLAAAQATSALSTAARNNAETTATKAGSWTSDIIGSEAAGKTSSWLNNAMDNVSQKINAIVNGITTNSASRGASSYDFHPFGYGSSQPDSQ